jgi:hypothetical protein
VLKFENKDHAPRLQSEQHSAREPKSILVPFNNGQPTRMSKLVHAEVQNEEPS